MHGINYKVFTTEGGTSLHYTVILQVYMRLIFGCADCERTCMYLCLASDSLEICKSLLHQSHLIRNLRRA